MTRFLTWFLIAALLVAWPELTSALLGTAVWSLQQPAVLVLALFALGVRRLGQQVQQQAARGWAP